MFRLYLWLFLLLVFCVFTILFLLNYISIWPSLATVVLTKNLRLLLGKD